MASTEERKFVYLVTSGRYSDYGVEAVFDSREAAEEFRQFSDSRKGRWHDETNELEVYPLNPLVEERRQGLSVYFVTIAHDTTVMRCEERITDGSIGEALAEPWRGQGGGGAFSGHVLARDEAHAVKVMSERRARFLAGVDG